MRRWEEDLREVVAMVVTEVVEVVIKEEEAMVSNMTLASILQEHQQVCQVDSLQQDLVSQTTLLSGRSTTAAWACTRRRS